MLVDATSKIGSSTHVCIEVLLFSLLLLLVFCFVSRDANWQFVSIVVKLVRNRTLRK